MNQWAIWSGVRNVPLIITETIHALTGEERRTVVVNFILAGLTLRNAVVITMNAACVVV